MNLPRPSKIICVGRNYVDHARELGNEVPEQPLIFMKPPSSLISDGEPIVLPPQSQRVEHEGEIGVGGRGAEPRAGLERQGGILLSQGTRASISSVQFWTTSMLAGVASASGPRAFSIRNRVPSAETS